MHNFKNPQRASGSPGNKTGKNPSFFAKLFHCMMIKAKRSEALKIEERLAGISESMRKHISEISLLEKEARRALDSKDMNSYDEIFNISVAPSFGKSIAFSEELFLLEEHAKEYMEFSKDLSGELLFAKNQLYGITDIWARFLVADLDKSLLRSLSNLLGKTSLERKHFILDVSFLIILTPR